MTYYATYDYADYAAEQRRETEDDDMINDNDLRGYLDNRVPSRENCERVRAAGIVAEDIWVQEFADTLLDIRQAIRGGERHPAKHWDEPDPH